MIKKTRLVDLHKKDALDRKVEAEEEEVKNVVNKKPEPEGVSWVVVARGRREEMFVPWGLIWMLERCGASLRVVFRYLRITTDWKSQDLFCFRLIYVKKIPVNNGLVLQKAFMMHIMAKKASKYYTLHDI